MTTDTFGTGGNQFTINFVPISGSSNPTDTSPSGSYGIVNYDYRIGRYEITNAQWTKFKAAYGTVTGKPADAYDSDPYYTGSDVPTNRVSWYEAAQFVNWLNTSTGHQAAYNFTGTQGTDNYTFGVWSAAEAWGGTNLYRHEDAYYFLPDEDEWVKAAYWSGTELQTYATKNGVMPVAGTDSNYGQSWWDDGPWDIGSGSEELNGTYDMMGNVWEFMESPETSNDYTPLAKRVMRGGAFDYLEDYLRASSRYYRYPKDEYLNLGFRVASAASVIPEPGSLLIWVVIAAVSLMCFGRRR